jgi:hypothetical protein
VLEGMPDKDALAILRQTPNLEKCTLHVARTLGDWNPGATKLSLASLRHIVITQGQEHLLSHLSLPSLSHITAKCETNRRGPESETLLPFFDHSFDYRTDLITKLTLYNYVNWHQYMPPVGDFLGMLSNLETLSLEFHAESLIPEEKSEEYFDVLFNALSGHSGTVVGLSPQLLRLELKSAPLRIGVPLVDMLEARAASLLPIQSLYANFHCSSKKKFDRAFMRGTRPNGWDGICARLEKLQETTGVDIHLSLDI